MMILHVDSRKEMSIKIAFEKSYWLNEHKYFFKLKKQNRKIRYMKSFIITNIKAYWECVN